MRSWLMLGGFLLVCFSVAFFGASFEPGPWYDGLNKPAWNPPNWLFAPVWTVLYISIAVAGWWVWRLKGFAGAKAAFTVYGLQLLANGAWSWLFFGRHQINWALAEILLLLGLIVLNVIVFAKVKRRIGLLLLPYLAWVAFASVLNFALWQMNVTRF